MNEERQSDWHRTGSGTAARLRENSRERDIRHTQEVGSNRHTKDPRQRSEELHRIKDIENIPRTF